MPEQKITFVNGLPAKCGCKMEFSSGGGHDSDVLYVTSCEAHSGSKQFGPSEVKRDGNGWWWHQGIPDFGGTEDPAPYHAWLAEESLELREWSMERDLDNPPTSMEQWAVRAVEAGIRSHQARSGSYWGFSILKTDRTCIGRAE